MYDDVEVPQFGILLAPLIGDVPQPVQPALLAGLEREAAARYRDWADQVEGRSREVLLACAGREQEIAERVDRLFPIDDAARQKVEKVLEKARPLYVGALAGRPLGEQLYVQSEAELQGEAAWSGMAAAAPDDVARELHAIAALEVASSQAVKKLLSQGI